MLKVTPLVFFLYIGFASTVFPALAAQKDSAVVPKGSGARMCVLMPADFRAVKLNVSAPSAHVDDNGRSVYCVYGTHVGASGGVELDVFYPAGDTPQEVGQTFKTTLESDPSAQYQPEGVPWAEASFVALDIRERGQPPFAANAVMRKDLVFSISLPMSHVARAQLLQLSGIVIKRLQGVGP